MYFIRLYDRILTDAEKAQNHFADGDVSAANYQSKLVYRGFVTVEKDGQSRTFYTDMAGETFPADGVSCYEVAQVFLAKEAYANNAALLKVKQTVGGE